jgi:hypothetical protein
LRIRLQASDTGGSDAVSVNLQSKVLKTIGVHNGAHIVGLGKLQGSLVSVGALNVRNIILGDGRDVEKAVEKVGSPEEVELALGDLVAARAHLREVKTLKVGGAANDGLGGSCVSTVVSSPGRDLGAIWKSVISA